MMHGAVVEPSHMRVQGCMFDPPRMNVAFSFSNGVDWNDENTLLRNGNISHVIT